MKIEGTKISAIKLFYSRHTRTGMVILLVATMWIGLAACRSQNAGQPVVRRYALQGKVVVVDRGRGRVTVEHGEIPGYMEAMTMPFALKDERLFDELREGDRIRATVVVESATNRTWLEDVVINHGG